MAKNDEKQWGERALELLQADREGRVFVLPCKIGDTVYRIQYVQKPDGRFRMGVEEFKFTLLCLYEMGERIFLTREEAEKALEKMKE